MHISTNWLCDIIPGLDKIPAHDLADRLTMSGLEVESFNDRAAKLKGIVVGLVVTRDKHPNADKLSLCRVSIGSEAFQVVCGAPNVTAGKKYPFATLGTTMPGGLEIKPIKLRGVESFGMLCSAKELELSDETSGLYELNDDAPIGKDIAKILGVDDVIMGLNVTPNRGDALSHWGVARDVAALTGLKPDFSRVAPGIIVAASSDESRKSNEPASLSIELADEKACPRYSASEIRGVKIAPSPAWLKSRLEALGLRSINNVVDATNYVLMLTGQPVHAFDAREVSGGAIRIYSLDQPRKFKTLDGAERDLIAGDLVIADASRPVALAGIMGGENSEVRDDTTDLILEVAMFSPDVIRKTSRRLGLQTDSSYRFSRFVNPDAVLDCHGVLRALITALAGGTPGPIQDFYPRPHLPRTIALPQSEIPRLLGIEIPDPDVSRIFSGLGCEVNPKAYGWDVTVPVSRSDLERPADLVEELARIYGMDKIPAMMPRMTVRSSEEPAAFSRETTIKSFFVARGFAETVHYSFGETKFFEQVLRCPASEMFLLKNPLSEDLAAMRPSLLPQLLSCYKKNRLNTDRGLRLFEARKTYARDGSERRILAFLYAGNPYGRNAYGLSRDSDFYDGKGLLAGFFAAGRLSVTESLHTEWPFHPGQSVRFSWRKNSVATFGALHPELLQTLKIKDALYYGEIEYDVIVGEYGSAKPHYHAVGSLPPVYRDVALLVPKNLSHAQLLDAIAADKPNELKHVELFDSYEGANIPDDKKSLAYSFLYQPENESLTDEAVNKLHFALVAKLQEKLGVALR